MDNVGLVPATYFFTRHRHSNLFYVIILMGRGGGQVVSVLAFYSNDLSSNPADDYKTKIKEKEAGVGPSFLNVIILIRILQLMKYYP